MLQVARDGPYESPVKTLLSGLRLAEKMSIILVIVVQWTRCLLRHWRGSGCQETRGTSDGLKGTSFAGLQRERTRGGGRALECPGMAVLSLTNLLCIGEAWTISSLGDGKLCFMGEKLRSGDHEQELGPWASRWMRFIKEERQKCGVGDWYPCITDVAANRAG